jgi:hypothetical protein
VVAVLEETEEVLERTSIGAWVHTRPGVQFDRLT